MTPGERNLAGTEQPRRFYELDSLRGLAAGIVMLNHFSALLPERLRLLISTTPLCVLIQGRQAVVLFFCLSGFVLTLPYARNSSLNYRAFLLKRVCRIYLPYLAALALSILADAASPHIPANITRSFASNQWIGQTWTQPIAFPLVWQHIIFLGHYPWAQFNTAFWSLVYEMRISLVFPFIAVAVLGSRWRRSLTGAFLLWLAALLLYRYGPARLHLQPDLANDMGVTLFYAVFFVLGALLAKNLARADAWILRWTRTEVALIAVASFVLYGYVELLLPLRHAPAGFFEVCSGAGTLGFIVLAIHCGPVQRVLTGDLIHHLGKISYSLYLMHGIVLFLLIHTLFLRLPLLALFGLYLVLCLAAAEVFHRTVELPAMRLGRVLTAPRPSPQPLSRRSVVT